MARSILLVSRVKKTREPIVRYCAFLPFAHPAFVPSCRYSTGFFIGIILSGIIMGVVSSAVDTIIVCYAEAPRELDANHPEISQEFESTWQTAWPDLNFRGIAVVSLGGGLGIV